MFNFFRFRILFLNYLALIIYIISPVKLYSQQDNDSNSQIDNSSDDIQFLPAVNLDKLVQNSTVRFMTNYYHPGKVSGIIGVDTIPIKDVRPLDTCIIETKNYDKVLFYWDYVERTTGIPKKQYWYFNVLPKNKFESTTIPLKELIWDKDTSYNMKFSNEELGKLIGQKLYEVKITDEVNQNQIIVFPLEESSPFIEVLKIDSGLTFAIYHIKLKSDTEFFNNLSEDQNKRWRKGEEINIPIGILMRDKNVSSYYRRLNYVLTKIKKKVTK